MVTSRASASGWLQRSRGRRGGGGYASADSGPRASIRHWPAGDALLLGQPRALLVRHTTAPKCAGWASVREPRAAAGLEWGVVMVTTWAARDVFSTINSPRPDRLIMRTPNKLLQILRAPLNEYPFLALPLMDQRSSKRGNQPPLAEMAAAAVVRTPQGSARSSRARGSYRQTCCIRNNG